MTLAALLNAAALRQIADALDRLTETTAQTGVVLCAYSGNHVEVNGDVTLCVDSRKSGDTWEYVVDLAGA